MLIFVKICYVEEVMKPSAVDRSITDSVQEPSSYTVAAAEIGLIIRASNSTSEGFSFCSK